jgi:K+ transporter
MHGIADFDRRLGLVYTSETIQGQVYIPSVNWARESDL